jgi:hypothetical protein
MSRGLHTVGAVRAPRRFSKLIAPLLLIAVTSGCAYIKQVSSPTGAIPASLTPGLSGSVGTAAVSADGRYVAYAAGTDTSAPGAVSQVYVLDTQTGTRTMVSVNNQGQPGDQFAGDPAISGNGRYVAFDSFSDNLVPNDTNGVGDVFVRDTLTNTTTLVSVTSAGAEVTDDSYNPSITDDGRYVVFTSDSDDLSPLDGNASSDVYLHDNQTGATTLMSSYADGTPTDDGAWSGSISADGTTVVFDTDTGINITDDQNFSDDVYSRPRTSRTFTWISKGSDSVDGGGGGDDPVISANGRFIAYDSNASDLGTVTDTTGFLDVYVRDRTALTTTRVSVTPTGGILGANSFGPAISRDGSRIAFLSSGDPTGTDTNGADNDLLVRDMTLAKTYLVSTDMFGNQLPVASSDAAISGDGKYGFWSTIGQYDTTTDTNTLTDIYDRAVDLPHITSVTPANVTPGQTVTLTINGSAFATNATVADPSGWATLGTVTRISDTKMTAVVTILPNAPSGGHQIQVDDPGTGPGPQGGSLALCTCINTP